MQPVVLSHSDPRRFLSSGPEYMPKFQHIYKNFKKVI